MGQRPQSQVQKDKQSFSNKNLHHGINLLAKTSSKKKFLDMYASLIKREKAKLRSKKKPEKRKKMIVTESESDDEMFSLPMKKSKKEIQQYLRCDCQREGISEEKLKWLKGHGELTGEEGNNNIPLTINPFTLDNYLWNQ
jgi:hypothetical protein